MMQGMHALAALALVAFFAQQPACRTVNLVLPHALRGDEAAVLLVSVGKIPHGAEIEVTTPSGQPLGTISPYGIRAGHEVGTYTIPVPREVISKRRVSVLLTLRYNGERRAPTAKEVKRVRVDVRRE